MNNKKKQDEVKYSSKIEEQEHMIPTIPTCTQRSMPTCTPPTITPMHTTKYFTIQHTEYTTEEQKNKDTTHHYANNI